MHDLRPMGLKDASLALGVDPFELIRMLVGTESVPPGLVFDQAMIATLREREGIEDSWWSDTTLPEDGNPARALVRGALGLLLERGHIGGEGTRLDNVGRGLSAGDQTVLMDALTVLSDEGHIVLVGSKTGTRVTIHPDSEDQVRALAAGQGDESALSALYEG